MRWTEEEFIDYLAKSRKKAVSQPNAKPQTVKSDICKVNTETGNIEIVIPVAPITKKNHSNIISYGSRCPSCGKGQYSKLIPSTAYKKYETSVSPYMDEIHRLVGTICIPVNLSCKFYCSKHYKSDLVGYLQAIQDILVENNILDDDNRNIVASTDGSRVFFDSQNPRTEITISKVENYEQW